jgi:acyl carrier protein
MSTAEGLGLFDVALTVGEPVVVPVKLDMSALRARGDDVPQVLRGLSGMPRRVGAAPTTGAGTLPQRLATLPPAERDDFMIEVVAERVAAVLGHASSAAVQPAKAFQELGFDSLAAVELRNQLSALAGQPLPATLVFEYPTPTALARYLRQVIVPAPVDPATPALAELDRLEASLAMITPAGAGDARITARLEALLRRVRDAADPDPVRGHRFRDATDDELFEILDDELGIS